MQEATIYKPLPQRLCNVSSPLLALVGSTWEENWTVGVSIVRAESGVLP